MAKQKFDDPLENIDPIMEQAFSVNNATLVDDSIDELPTDEEEKEEEEGLEELKEYAPAPEKEENKASAVFKVQFPDLSNEVNGKQVEDDIFSDIPVTLSVELGRSKISMKEVLELTEGSIIELERFVGEPLDLVINGQCIAQGEVVAIDNNYGLRVTNIISHLQR
jgi:flagellar motor switch protein FliN/FliY